MNRDRSSLSRRTFIATTIGYTLNNRIAMSNLDLRTCSIEMRGGWDNLVGPSKTVLEKVRRACLNNVTSWSPRQPSAIIIENRVSDYPSIWLHSEPRTAAWIRLNAAPQAWCQLAYQFGHELGHVLANSWTAEANPRMPSQWIEEALAEGLSLFGLKQLAKNWSVDPPFPGNQSYSQEIENYHFNTIAGYSKLGKAAGIHYTKNWYAKEEEKLERDNGLEEREKEFSVLIFSALQRDPSMTTDYGALNQWPERTGLENREYIAKWTASCKTIGTSGKLPKYIDSLLFGG